MRPEESVESAPHATPPKGLIPLLGLWRGLIRYVPPARVTIPKFIELAMRLPSLGVRRMRMRDGGLLEGDVRDVIVGTIWLVGEWEPGLSNWMRSRLRPGTTFIDVGANVGAHTLTAARAVGASGNVVAIEADPDTFQLLRRNIDLNKLTNVRPVWIAAGERSAGVDLYRGPAGNSGMASTRPPIDWTAGGATTSVASAPLHEILTAAELQNARLIKIDIEGGEARLIPTLTHLFPMLPDSLEFVIEFETRRYSADERSELVAPFLAAGYKMFHIDSARYGAIPTPVTVQWFRDLPGDDVDVLFTKQDTVS